MALLDVLSIMSTVEWTLWMVIKSSSINKNFFIILNVLGLINFTIQYDLIILIIFLINPNTIRK